MKSSLIPEKPILVYPSLAATVGLDESVMLSVLSDLSTHQEAIQNRGFAWHSVHVKALEEALPFWDRRDLQRVSTSLREKGVILIASAPLLQEDTFKFAFNEKLQSAKSPAPPPAAGHTPSQGFGKNYISVNWRPDQTTLDQLAQLNIPNEFAFQQLPEFVTYWRERNEAHRSWGQKFINHTLQRWRTFEAQEQRRNRAQLITSDWTPSEETMSALSNQNIPKQFALDQIREFITYWQDAGERHISWDSKFIQQVQSRWADMEARRNISNKEFPIFENWRPSQDAMEVMTNKSEIPLSFIEDSIPEFIIYWQEKGTQSNTWNSLFIKHMRLQWHRYQHALDNNVDAQLIQPQWQPSADVYDILKLANIDASFARELVPEFVLYWRDRNELHRSWNSKFLQHVKRTWAARHQMTADTNHAERSTRDISLEEELNDTSWAN